MHFPAFWHERLRTIVCESFPHREEVRQSLLSKLNEGNIFLVLLIFHFNSPLNSIFTGLGLKHTCSNLLLLFQWSNPVLSFMNITRVLKSWKSVGFRRLSATFTSATAGTEKKDITDVHGWSEDWEVNHKPLSHYYGKLQPEVSPPSHPPVELKSI